jgi:hypothetical protein
LASTSASAQISCGDGKDVPIAVQEQLKGDVQGKAQLLTKLLPGAELKGTIETSRTELHEQHQNVDQHQLDMYFMWVICQTISADKTLTTPEKPKLWGEARASSPGKPARNPNALYQYGEPVADVQGAVISQAQGIVTFQGMHTTGKADPTREVEYQDWVLLCPDLPRPPSNAFVGQFSGVVAGGRCTILRKAP